MNPIVRNILAVVVGLISGGIVNMSLITVSGSIIPPPEGADFSTTEGLLASADLMEPKHFIMPFLAHALGTLLGAFLAALIAANRKLIFAMVIGVVTLIGGIGAVMMIPAPMWFNVLDLTMAYIPMAFIGWKLATMSKNSTN
ncbi:MAG: hypothetical protein IT236_17385 [Bacteroidia bacterium]|nr:hypothetical protein [Bacteroidia bacterium]